MREDRRRHYDDGFRREALELIKAGAGKGVLAGRLAIPAYTARNWIRLYRSGGEEAVMGSNGSRRYDWETKVACFASMFVRQVRQCFSVVWADGFPRCRHRFPVM